jgi:hypothetical protein
MSGDFMSIVQDIIPEVIPCQKYHMNMGPIFYGHEYMGILKLLVRGPFEKFVDWRQCVAVIQREAVTYAKL